MDLITPRPYELLKQVPIFSQMDLQDIAHISRQCRTVSFKAREIIFKEGDFASDLFLLIKGEVDIIKNLGCPNEMKLRKLTAQDYFGEMALLDKHVRSASVVSRTQAKALCISKLDFKKIIRKDPHLSLIMLRTVIKRLRYLESGMLSTLEAFLPICSGCKRIRDKKGTWVPIERYIKSHTYSEFSHSICSSCAKSLYPELSVSETKS